MVAAYTIVLNPRCAITRLTTSANGGPPCSHATRDASQVGTLIATEGAVGSACIGMTRINAPFASACRSLAARSACASVPGGEALRTDVDPASCNRDGYRLLSI